MAQLDSTEFKIQTQTLFPTNTVGSISAADLRQQMDNIADSLLFGITGQTAPPTANDDDAGTAGNGVFQVGNVWIDETNDIVYVCVNSSTSAAIWVDVTSNSSLTDAEIKTAYENNPDTNAFTDAEQTKLTGIEANATADQTGTEIVAAIDTELGSGVWQTGGGATPVQDEGSLILGSPSALNFVGTNVTVTDVGGVATITVTGGTGTVDFVSNVAQDTILGRITSGSGDSEELTPVQLRTLINVEDGATADQTGTEIVAAIDTELGQTDWKTNLVTIVPINSDTTLSATNSNSISEIDTSSNVVNVTVPLNATVAIPVGSIYNFVLVDSTNAANIITEAGVSLNGVTGGSSVISNADYSSVSLYKSSTNSWIIQGDIQ